MRHPLAASVLAIVLATTTAATTVRAETARPAAKVTKAEEEAAAKQAAEAAAAAAAAAAKQAEQQAAAQAAAQAQRADDDAAAAAQAAQTKAQQAALSARGIDARMRALSDLLGLALKRLPGDHRAQSFAVMPFDEAGDETKQRSLGLVVSDMVVTNLARDHHLPLVERAALRRIMDELALQQTGAVDDKQLAELGKLSGARALVVGQVADVGAEFKITARVIDLETAGVIEAQDVTLPKAELVAFSADAVVLKSRSGAAFRSLVVPGWGQSYNGDNLKGWVMAGASYGLLLATIGATAWTANTVFNVYPTIGSTPETSSLSAADKGALAEQTRLDANTQATAAVVLGGATAGIWFVNVADAYLSGTDVESLDAALASR